MTLPEPIERVRMALAEVGYDPSDVIAGDLGGFHFNRNIGIEDGWRALETSDIDQPECLACVWRCVSSGDPRRHCLATRRFVRDCGVERSAIGSEVVASPPRVAASDRVAEPRAKSAIEQDAPPP